MLMDNEMEDFARRIFLKIFLNDFLKLQKDSTFI